MQNWVMLNYLSSVVMQLAEQKVKPMTTHIYSDSVYWEA